MATSFKAIPWQALVVMTVLLMGSVSVAQYTLSTPAGNPSSPGLTDGVGSAARLYYPVEMKGHGHADGSVYITDRSNRAIRKLNPSTNYLSTVATSVGSPSGISGADPSGNVYFCNEGNNPYQFLKITSGGVISVIASVTFRAYGVWYNNYDGYLYLSAIDICQIIKMNPVSGAYSVYGGGSCGSNSNNVYRTSAAFAAVLSAGGTSNGDYYFTQYTSYTANKIVYSSGYSYIIAGAYGQQGYVNGAAANSRFSYVYGIDATDDGYVYIADTNYNYIRMLYNGQVSTVAGNGASATTDGPALSNAISFPWGLSAHIAGKLYVVSYTGQSIRLVSGLPHTGDQFNLYCCTEVYTECASIHSECNALAGATSSMAAVCSIEPSYCDIYNYGVTFNGICSQMAAHCDALISTC